MQSVLDLVFANDVPPAEALCLRSSRTCLRLGYVTKGQLAQEQRLAVLGIAASITHERPTPDEAHSNTHCTESTCQRRGRNVITLVLAKQIVILCPSIR